MKNVKVIYSSEEVKEMLENVKNQQETTFIFNERDFGFSEDEIHITIKIDKFGDYTVESYETLDNIPTKTTVKTFSSRHTTTDYVWAVLGW